MTNETKPAALTIFIAAIAALTSETRCRAALDGAEILQGWAWRGGEAAVCRIWGRDRWSDQTFVIIRQGLRTGELRILHVGSIAAAFQAMEKTYRVGTRRPRMPRTAREEQRATIARAARRAGNIFRTLRASNGAQLAA